MTEAILMQPIGIIRSPYHEVKGMPIQGIFASDVQGIVELKPQFAGGFRDLAEFSHAILLYYFHKSDSEKLIGKPFLESEEHGIFANATPSKYLSGVTHHEKSISFVPDSHHSRHSSNPCSSDRRDGR